MSVNVRNRLLTSVYSLSKASRRVGFTCPSQKISGFSSFVVVLMLLRANLSIRLGFSFRSLRLNYSALQGLHARTQKFYPRSAIHGPSDGLQAVDLGVELPAAPETADPPAEEICILYAIACGQ
jgi:hypothetical protein